jgi:predicted chitinase
MNINRPKFFSTYRLHFSPILTQSQVDGYTTILDHWEAIALTDTRWLAYILATAYHETGTLMQPVREGFCNTDQGSIQAVTKLYQKGIIAENYALSKPNGNSYFGRGLVQITFDNNYKKLGEAIGLGSQLYDTIILT